MRTHHNDVRSLLDRRFHDALRGYPGRDLRRYADAAIRMTELHLRKPSLGLMGHLHLQVGQPDEVPIARHAVTRRFDDVKEVNGRAKSSRKVKRIVEREIGRPAEVRRNQDAF